LRSTEPAPHWRTHLGLPAQKAIFSCSVVSSLRIFFGGPENLLSPHFPAAGQPWRGCEMRYRPGHDMSHERTAIPPISTLFPTTTTRLPNSAVRLQLTGRKFRNRQQENAL